MGREAQHPDRADGRHVRGTKSVSDPIRKKKHVNTDKKSKSNNSTPSFDHSSLLIAIRERVTEETKGEDRPILDKPDTKNASENCERTTTQQQATPPTASKRASSPNFSDDRRSENEPEGDEPSENGTGEVSFPALSISPALSPCPATLFPSLSPLTSLERQIDLPGALNFSESMKPEPTGTPDCDPECEPLILNTHLVGVESKVERHKSEEALRQLLTLNRTHGRAYKEVDQTESFALSLSSRSPGIKETNTTGLPVDVRALIALLGGTSRDQETAAEMETQIPVGNCYAADTTSNSAASQGITGRTEGRSMDSPLWLRLKNSLQTLLQARMLLVCPILLLSIKLASHIVSIALNSLLLEGNCGIQSANIPRDDG